MKATDFAKQVRSALDLHKRLAELDESAVYAAGVVGSADDPTRSMLHELDDDSAVLIYNTQAGVQVETLTAKQNLARREEAEAENERQLEVARQQALKDAAPTGR